MVVARMPDHGLVLTMVDTSNVRMIFPIVWWMRSMIALDWGFLVGIGFLFLKAIVVLTDLGKFSHKFGTAIKHNSLWKWVTSKPSFSVISYISAAIFLDICAISNHPVAGSIILRHHNLFRFYLLPRIVYGPMRSTHSVPQVFVSACLGGSLLYLWLVVVSLWHVGHFLQMPWNAVQKNFQSKCWRRVCSIQVSPGRQSISWYQSTFFFCSAVRKNILLFWHIKR